MELFISYWLGFQFFFYQNSMNAAFLFILFIFFQPDINLASPENKNFVTNYVAHTYTRFCVWQTFATFFGFYDPMPLLLLLRLKLSVARACRAKDIFGCTNFLLHFLATCLRIRISNTVDRICTSTWARLQMIAYFSVGNSPPPCLKLQFSFFNYLETIQLHGQHMEQARWTGVLPKLASSVCLAFFLRKQAIFFTEAGRRRNSSSQRLRTTTGRWPHWEKSQIRTIIKFGEIAAKIRQRHQSIAWTFLTAVLCSDFCRADSPFGRRAVR